MEEFVLLDAKTFYVQLRMMKSNLAMNTNLATSTYKFFGLMSEESMTYSAYYRLHRFDGMEICDLVVYVLLCIYSV